MTDPSIPPPGAAPGRKSHAARRWAITVLTIGGVALCVWLIERAGWQATVTSLLQLRGWLVLLLGLELARGGCEFLSTWAVLGPRAHAVPALVLLRAQLFALAFAILLPLGRSAGEAFKAALIAPHAGVAPALAVGAAGQVIALWVNGAVCVVGALAAVAWDAPLAVSAGCAALGVGMLGLATLVQLGARARALQDAIARRFGLTPWIAEFDRAFAHGHAFSPLAFAGQGLARAVQALQLGVLATLLGVTSGLLAAPLLQAVYVLGSSAGDLIPAQLGTVDSAFALAAPLLHMPPPTAVTLALALHSVQVMTALGLLLLAALLSRAFDSHAGARTLEP